MSEPGHQEIRKAQGESFPFRLRFHLLLLAGVVVFLFPQLSPAGSPHPPEEEIRRQLQEVLSRPEFSKGPKSSFWLDLLVKIGDVVGWLGSLRSTAPLLFWLLLVGCGVLLALLVTHISLMVRRALIVSPRRPGAEAPHEKRGRLSDTYREEARRRAGQGEFTEAIRFLFLSLVYRFDESGRILFHGSYTNREYLTLFEDRPQMYADLKVFVDTLDEHWYGQHPTDRQQYENCLALAESLA